MVYISYQKEEEIVDNFKVWENTLKWGTINMVFIAVSQVNMSANAKYVCRWVPKGSTGPQ